MYEKHEKEQFVVDYPHLSAFIMEYVLSYKARAITDRLSFLRVACFIFAEIQENYLKLWKLHALLCRSSKKEHSVTALWNIYLESVLKKKKNKKTHWSIFYDKCFMKLMERKRTLLNRLSPENKQVFSVSLKCNSRDAEDDLLVSNNNFISTIVYQRLSV